MADGSIVIDTRIDSSGAEKGIGKLISIASKVGSDFEAGMSKVQAISGASAEEIAKLSEKAKEMGSKTKFSATESAEALQYMAMAGWKTDQMMSGLPGIMNLAAASGEDLALVSDIVTDALTAFGMSAKDSAQFADLLASAASNSNTNVSMLGESFKYVAPVAGALGHSAKDSAFALGLMANAGIKGSQSGTALRASLTNLAHPSKQMAKEMDRLGISLTDSNGQVKEGKALYDELRQKFSGLTDAQKTSSAATIFGKEAMSGMLAIINASDEDYKKLYENLSNCDGAAEEMADTMNDNLKGQITLLGSALEGLGIELYESVNNPMKDVAQTANEMVQQLTNAFKEGGLTGLVTELGNVFATIITNIASQLPQIIELAVQVIQSFITGIQNNLPLIASSAIEIIQTLITGFITVLPQIIQVGLQLIVELGTGIAQAIPTLIPQIINLVVSICDMIINNLPTIIQVGLEIIVALAQGLADNLPTLIQEVPRIINSFCDALFGQLPQIIVAGVKIILALIKGLIEAIPTLIANIPQIIMAIVNAVSLYNWIGLGKSVITKMGDGIIAMKGNIGNIAKGVAEWVGTSITNIFKGGLSWGKNLISSIGQGFSSMISFLGSSASSVANSALNAIKSAFSGGFNIGKNLIQGIWDGISNMKQWILDKIGGFAGSIISGIKGAFGIHSPSRVMRDLIGKNLVRGIGVGVDTETPKVTKDILDNMNSLTAKMQATVDYETSKTSRAITSKFKRATTNTVTNNNNNGVTQNVTIVNPERTPAENARALKKVGRDLAFGY